MGFVRPFLAGLAATLTLLTGPAQSSIDDVRVALAAAAPVVRDWDPAGFPAPRLAPGESLHLHLASGRALRVALRAADGDSTALTFRSGEGQGLRRIVRPRVEAGAYVLAAETAPRIVEIVRPAGTGSAVVLDIGTGAFVLDDTGLDYARPVPLPGEVRQLVWQEPRHQDIRLIGGAQRHGAPYREADTETRDYVLRARGEPTALRLMGPLRLRVETRLLPEETSALYRPYRVDWSLDGRAMRPLTFEESWDLRRAFRWAAGGTAGVTGAQSGYIDIPEGSHVLRFAPSRAMLLRADALGGSLARPGSNASPGLSKAVAAATRTARGRWTDVTWGVLEGRPVRPLSPDMPAAELEHHARNLARTNSLSGGGMLAADMLRAKALETPQVRAVAAAAERFSGAYGFYRTLEPLNGYGRGQALWDTPPQLMEPAETPRTGPSEAVPGEVLLASLVSGRFHPVPARGALDYVVPERTASARLRLIVDRGGHDAPVRLRLKADGHAPLVLDLDPRMRGFNGLLATSPAAIGLGRAARAAGITEDAFARAALAADGLPRAGRASLASLDLVLDHPVSRLRLSAESASGRPVRVALAARASRHSRLDPPAYLAERNTLGPDAARHLFFHGLDAAIGCARWLSEPAACDIAPVGGDRDAQAELYNDFVPTLRLLRSRERLVFDAVREAPAVAGTGGVRDPVQAARLTARGRAWLEAGQPLAALEDFTHALAFAPEGRGSVALEGQVAALDALGETFLPERLLRRAALDCGGLGPAARAGLAERYAAAGDLDRQLGVEARGLLCAGTAQNLDRLTAILAADGRDAEALRIAALTWGRPAVDLSAAASRGGWPGAAVPAALATGHTVAAAGLVQQSAGAIPVRVPARDLVAQWYRATPARPVVFVAPASGRIELSVRPVHVGSALRLDGAVAVESDAGTALRAITGNRVSPGLEVLSGAGALGSGTTWARTVRTGERIAIRPQGFSVAVDARFVPGAEAEAEPEPALSQLSRLFMDYRAEPESQAALLPRAARLGAPIVPRHPEIARLWSAIRADARWERVERVSASAGITEEATPDLPFDSPVLRTRAALANGFDPGARNVPAGDTLVVRRRAEDAAEVMAELTLSTLPAIPAPSVTVIVTETGGATREIALGPERRRVALPLAFAAGESAVRLRLAAPAVNAFVQLRVTEADAAGLAAQSGERRRLFDVATEAEPVLYIPSAPEVVRVDEYRDGRLLSRIAIAAPDAPLELRPEAGAPRALFRVFRLVPEASGAEDADIALVEDETGEAVASARNAVTALPRLDGAGALALAYPDALVAGRRVELLPGRPGTWSLGATFMRRTVNDSSERVAQIEFSARYRRYWPGHDLYSDVEALVRPREVGPAAFGLRGRLAWPDRLGGITFGAGAQLYLQPLDRTAWRLRFGVDAERDILLTDTLDLTLSGGLFLAAMSHDEAPGGDAARVDADVHSAYLADHRSGLWGSAELDWRPYDDLRLFAGLTLSGNGGRDLLTLDQAQLEAGLRHYAGGLRYGLTAGHSVSFDDADRDGRSARSEIEVEAVWERWLHRNGRIEVGGVLGHRTDRDGLAGEAFLTWHFGGGFEDVAPDAIAFRGLREDARYRRLEERYGE